MADSIKGFQNSVGNDRRVVVVVVVVITVVVDVVVGEVCILCIFLLPLARSSSDMQMSLTKTDTVVVII